MAKTIAPQLKPEEKKKLRDEAIVEVKIQNEQKLKLLDELIENVDNYKKYTDYNESWEHLDVLRRTVCKNLTNAEFYYYLEVCHKLGLDAYLKQIWCYKDKRDNVVIIVGRDGYFAHCEKQTGWRGMSRGVIYESDHFIPNYANQSVDHTAQSFVSNRGKIVGAWAICRRDGFDPVLMTVYFDEYAKTYDSSPWKSNPSSMIIKVAELEAMRKQFPISGVQNEHDWDVDSTGRVKPHDKSKKIDDLLGESLTEAKRELLELISSSKHPNKESIRKDIQDNIKINALDIERINFYKEQLLTQQDKSEEE